MLQAFNYPSRTAAAVAPGAVGTVELADGSVATVDIANDAITYAKIQNVSATDKILGRSSGGAGDIEEITCTSFARSILDDADAAAVITTLGLAAIYQPLDATLTALAGVTVAADQLIYATGADAFAAASLTAFGRSLIDDADNTAGRTTLGLGTIATQSAASVALTGGAIDNVAIGGTTRTTGKFTTVTANTLELDSTGIAGVNTIYMSVSDSLMNFRVNSGTRAWLNASGDFNLGSSNTNAVDSAAGVFPLLFVHTFGSATLAAGGQGNMTLQNWSNSVGGPGLWFGKSRSGTAGTQTVVQSGDCLGVISFSGSDGGSKELAALIAAVVDGTPGSNDMPGRLEFYTTADGANTPTLALTIDAAQQLKFGSASFTANATTATVLGSLGPAGANTTVQQWLTIKNNSGTVRYIPCF